MNVDRVSTAVVDRAIEQASARLRTVSALSAALVIGAAAIAYIAFAVIADHLFTGGLSLNVRRTGLALAGILVAAFTATRVIRPAFRRVNQLYSAWLLERARPDLRHAVTTTLLLRGRNDVHAGVSSGLAFQAARAVRRIDVNGVVSDKSLRQAGIAIAVVIGAFGLYGLVAPKQVRPSVLRVLGADVPAPTQTAVDIIAPGPDASVVVGTPVEFEVALKGRLPDSAWVEFSTDEGRTWPAGKHLSLAAPLDQSSTSPTWIATRDGADIAATQWYRVHAGDARCDIRKIEVRPQPVVTSHSVEVTWPDYAKREETSHSDGPIDALVGAKAALTVRTNVPASDGRVVFHDAAGDFSRQMSIDDSDRRLLRATWIIDRDAEYEVQFNDLHGAGNPEPIRYTQRARGDRPPEIIQTAPPASFTAARSDAFKIQARISDDWGLSRVVLSYRGMRGSGVIDLSKEVLTGRPIVELDRTVFVELLGGEAGDVIELHLEATDTRVNLRGVGEPQVTRGPTSELRVTGEKGSAGKSNSPNRTGNVNTPSSKKTGDQPAGGGDKPGQQGGKDGAGKPDQGDKSGEGESAPSKGGEQGEGASKSGEGESGKTSEPGETGKPRQPESKPGDESGKSAGKETPENGDAPDSTKPTPSDKGDNSGTTDDSGPPASKPNGAGDKGDAQPSDAGSGDKPSDAQADLDKLIRKNKDALERLNKKKDDGNDKSGEPAESKEDKGDSPKGDGSAKKDDAEKKDGAKPAANGSTPGDATKQAEKPAGKTKDGEGSSSDKKKESLQPGNGESSKPGTQAEANEGESKPTHGKTGDKTDAEAQAGKKPGAEGQRGESQQGAASQNAGSKGDAKAKPGEGQQPDGDEKGKSDSSESDSSKVAKDPAKNGDGKNEQPGASTPKPAQGVGPTPPSSGGGVVEDAGAGNPDGKFEDGAKSEPLDAPMRDRARKAVDELERRLRDGGVSDAELRDLGWSRADARNFVSRYRRLQKAAQEQRDGGLFSGKVRTDSGDSKANGKDPASGVGRGMAGAVRGDSRAVKDAAHAQDAPPESVPPELRDVLDEYYRSMSRQGEAKVKSDK